MSDWINHVKKYQTAHNVTYKEALQQASKTYSGGSLKSNYIRNIIYKKNFDVNKMRQPSNHILKKFKSPDNEKVKSARQEKNIKKKQKENILKPYKKSEMEELEEL